MISEGELEDRISVILGGFTADLIQVLCDDTPIDRVVRTLFGGKAFADEMGYPNWEQQATETVKAAVATLEPEHQLVVARKCIEMMKIADAMLEGLE